MQYVSHHLRLAVVDESLTAVCMAGVRAVRATCLDDSFIM
eukprot:COSAG02_NODE_16936_length_1042_cov_1.211029_1_plen_39_part_10